MRILAPLLKTEEIEPLSASGADEFYCGLIDTDGSVNNRPNTERFNFTDKTELQKACDKARKLHKKMFLVLNKIAPKFKTAIDQAQFAKDIGFHGLILTDPLLVKVISDKNLGLTLDASSIAAVFNTSSIEFFQKLGIKRFHLPRQITLWNVMQIIRQTPRIDVSVFAIRDRCVNIGGFCSLHRLKNDHLGPCRNLKTLRILGKKHTISKTDLDFKLNMRKHTCGLCSLQALENLGVSTAKIEGREISLNEKIRTIKAVRSAIQSTRLNNNEYKLCCRTIFQRTFDEPCKPEYCYY